MKRNIKDAPPGMSREALDIWRETGMTPRQLAVDRELWIGRNAREQAEAESYANSCDQLMEDREELLAVLKAVEESKGTRLLFEVRKKVRDAIAKVRQ